jgi:transposase
MSGEGVVLEEDPQVEEIIARVAALDIGKAELVCCVRVPHEAKPGRRLQQVQTYSTTTRSLLEMADHLRSLGVTRVVREATSDSGKPVFSLLEAQGFETWLVNARDVKHLPGRPKTDKLDSVWLCKLAERQMLRPSFVPPADIQRLREVTRYRVELVGARTAEKQPGGEAARRCPEQAVGRGQRHFRGVRARDDGRVGRRGVASWPSWPRWPRPGCAARSPR